MKRYVTIGLVLSVLVFASCRLGKGGTIEVINGHSTYSASITIMNGNVPVTEEKRAIPGEKVTFFIDEDGTYIVNANFYQTLPAFTGHGTGKAVLLGGNKETVRVKPSP